MLPAVQSQVRIILLDIEGTTTPVDFIYQTLFPYASSKMESFLREYFREPEIMSLIQSLHTKHQIDERQGSQPSAWMDEPDESRLRSAVAYSQWLMDKDSKCTALKSLQGKIWQEGYSEGNCMGGFMWTFLQRSSAGGSRKEKSASTPQAVFLRSSCFSEALLREI
jgi:methionine salvage enolase-phosphatase E1